MRIIYNDIIIHRLSGSWQGGRWMLLFWRSAISSTKAEELCCTSADSMSWDSQDCRLVILKISSKLAGQASYRTSVSIYAVILCWEVPDASSSRSLKETLGILTVMKDCIHFCSFSASFSISFFFFIFSKSRCVRIHSVWWRNQSKSLNKTGK